MLGHDKFGHLVAVFIPLDQGCQNSRPWGLLSYMSYMFSCFIWFMTRLVQTWMTSWWWAVHLDQVCCGRETSKTRRTCEPWGLDLDILPSGWGFFFFSWQILWFRHRSATNKHFYMNKFRNIYKWLFRELVLLHLSGKPVFLWPQEAMGMTDEKFEGGFP